MAANNLADYMEAAARNQKMEPPAGYGYSADVALRVGFLVDAKTTCKVLEKPICIPSGRKEVQGYMMLYAYCGKDGVESILSGQMPPMLPATLKEPIEFQSLTAIADNFGAKDPQAASSNSECCVAFRVPSELATQADTPGRDLWLVRFDQDQVGPFLQAAKDGEAAKVQKMLAAGVKGSVVDENGVSALMMAAMAGSTDTCKVLLDGNAEVNYQEPNAMRSALMFAAQGGHSAVVELLVKSSGDLSKVDSEGQTALMWAAVAGKADTARILASGGWKDAKNKEGLTALQIAEKIGHAETVAVLKG